MRSPVLPPLRALSWGSGIEIVDPEVVRESYVARLVELRKSKGMD
ncbi:Phosphate acetyltransferase [Leclercia adecarboxylata]|uniref:Phosphate acetyltransferase n=1 Tax=Leclercia adecarboxylata TaxID=83655 RepID=A0A4U9I6E3_9ENTR|nr:Phosphate acetyltransferase [Leclercia adecarboxylata]